MKLRIGTRGSKLALTQTGMVAEALRQAHPGLEFETVEIRTTGDNKQGTPRDSHSDKRDWIHELELALLSGEIDLAVHSGKDIPSEIAEATAICSVLPRATPFDIFIPHPHRVVKFSELPRGAVVGTASLRRRAQLLHLRPDLVVQEHRGNVPTRLDKLASSGELAGIVLAAAGVERLNLINERQLKVEQLTPPQFLPAINQGILAVQFRQASLARARDVSALVGSLVDEQTEARFQAERAVVKQLPADCNSALGIFASVITAELEVASAVFSRDGREVITDARRGSIADAVVLGAALGQALIDRGAKDLLAASRMNI